MTVHSSQVSSSFKPTSDGSQAHGPLTPVEMRHRQSVLRIEPQGDRLRLSWRDERDELWFDGHLFYRAVIAEGGKSVSQERPAFRSLRAGLREGSHELRIEGDFPSLSLSFVHGLTYNDALNGWCEAIELTNRSDQLLGLSELEIGLLHRVTDEYGHPLASSEKDQFVPVPLVVRPDDPAHAAHDCSVRGLLAQSGRMYRLNDRSPWDSGFLPGRHRCADGWVWQRGQRSLLMAKFSPDHLEFGVLSTVNAADGVHLRMGGCCLVDGLPASLTRIPAGETVRLGQTLYRFVDGEVTQALMSYRDGLDALGCRFPDDFDAPVLWNELYDNPDWWVTTPGNPARSVAGAEASGPHATDDVTPISTRHLTRQKLFTLDHLRQQAEQAATYACEALYLDPGWDTAFGSLIWDEARLGPMGEFVRWLHDNHKLKLALHAPLATWTSHDWNRGSVAIDTYPPSTWRLDAQGQRMSRRICPASPDYLNTAAQRLIHLCDQGVSFIMFDGNWYPGACHDPAHQHPLPYTYEDHAQASLELCRRVKAAHPKVQIEMHDPISGGSHLRFSPTYFGYAQPDHFDTTWGFELMWAPMRHLQEGQAVALYYYNLANNIPLYLHVDLRDDNEHCLVLWWYASTCRQLGIGGTHPTLHIARAQQAAMARYRQWMPYFKRGRFIGLNEQIHLHRHPTQQRLLACLFNLSNQAKQITGQCTIESLGLPLDAWYARSEPGLSTYQGKLYIDASLPAWGARVIEMYTV